MSDFITLPNGKRMGVVEFLSWWRSLKRNRRQALSMRGSGATVIPNPFVDNLTTSFPDPSVGATINVSGGGAALQTAVNAAGAGDRLLIIDSLNYDGNLLISGKTDLTIEADAGQTPTITAFPGTSNSCVRFGNGNLNVMLKGIGFIGNGNLNTLSIPDNGLVLGTPGVTGFSDADSITIRDCTFSELNPALGVPGIQLVGTDGTLHLRCKVIGCTFTDMATPAFTTGAGYGAITIGGWGVGGGDGVFVQNCKIIRTAVARGSSSMRGVVLKNKESTVEDVLCYDIGTAGSNECFKHNNEAQYGTVIGGTSDWRNCVAYNGKRGYRLTQAAATMTVSHCVFHNDISGLDAGQTIMLFSSGTAFIVRDSVIADAGDATAFSATVTEDHNDVFNVAAPGKVLDATDLTVDPLLSGVPLNDYRATDAQVSVGASNPAGSPMGVYYPGGTAIFWAGVP